MSTTVGICLVPIIGHSYCISCWERAGQYSRRIRGAKKSRWKIGCVGVWCSCIRITAAIVINPRSSWKPTFISDTDIANLHGITLQRIPAKTIRIKCLSWAACRYWVNVPASIAFQNAKSPRYVVLPPGNYPTHIPSLNWGSKKILYFGVPIHISIIARPFPAAIHIREGRTVRAHLHLELANTLSTPIWSALSNYTSHFGNPAKVHLPPFTYLIVLRWPGRWVVQPAWTVALTNWVTTPYAGCTTSRVCRYLSWNETTWSSI